ncbi:MAG: NADH-quinone oxidoreductase subunit N [Candidatus Sumerlaeaceae bacterium]|nr:NADH-quinone oxidoreductase subunit N [Candidatus Sumerlaeaceae bacterium]
MPAPVLLGELRLILPELILCGGALFVLVYDMFQRRERSQRCGVLALLIVGLAAWDGIRLWMVPGVWAAAPAQTAIFWGMLSADPLWAFFRLLFLAAAGAVILMSVFSHELWRTRAGEYYALLLIATASASFAAAACNFVMLVLAVETLSLSAYVLAGYLKGERPAAEASLKYLLFGSVASGVMLYGLSLLYGLTGSLDLASLDRIGPENYPVFIPVLALVLVGLGFKTGAAPFHFWAPDVYQGAPTPVTAFLATVSKGAGFAALIRVVSPHFDAGSLAPYGMRTVDVFATPTDLSSLFWLLAVLSMIVGNFAALRQRDIKRLLAYSSIAHAGYLFVPFTAANPSGLSAVLFYIIVYFLATIGVFAGVVMIHNRTGTFEIGRWTGLFHRSPVIVVGLGVMLWSLIGLPPTAGFVGKWKLFFAPVEAAAAGPLPLFHYSVVFVALLTSVVSLYYYIGILKVMCFSGTDDRALRFRSGPLERACILALALPLILIQLQWQPLTDATLRALGQPVRSASAEVAR